MKTAIVYYSMSGNTQLVARRVADALGADVIRIEPEKAYPNKGFRKFLWGGKSAVMGDRPALVPYEFDADKYDLVIIGSPIWASRVAPPIASFVAAHRDALAEKRVAFFACSSGGDSAKAAKRLAEALGVLRFEATASLVDPKIKKTPENDSAIADFIKALGKSGE